MSELEMMLCWAEEAQDDLKNESRSARTNVSMICSQLKEMIEREISDQ